MNPITPALLALTTAVLLFLFGYQLGQRSPHARGPVVPATLPADVPAAAAWLSREEAVDQLRALRGELEEGGEYGQVQALLLFDCCAFLGLDEGEIQAVIGVAWFDAIEEPANLEREED